MKKFYSVFLIFDLEPKYFYMWVNFVDLIFNNFNVDSKVLNNIQPDLRLLVKILLKISNLMNNLMLYLGILTYFIFIYIQKIRTPVHKAYVVIRFIVIFSRFVIFTGLLYFCIRYWYYCEEEERNWSLYKEIINSMVLVFLEFNDVKWCFDLREIVFHNEESNGVDYLDPSLRNIDNKASHSLKEIDVNSDLYKTESEREEENQSQNLKSQQIEN